MRAQPLELVGADRGAHGLPGAGQVGIEEGIGERSHGEPTGLRLMPEPRAVLRDHDGRDELVRAAAKRRQLRAGGGEGFGLVVELALAGQGGIRADHHRARPASRDAHGLHLGQRRCNVLRRGPFA